jgi:hypothetical protein
LTRSRARNARERAADSNAARAVTFAQEAEAYIEAHRAGWKDAKHVAQWTSTLETYAHPFIGKQLVSEIDTALVMKCLQPIWSTKTETASRLRGRIESVLDYATGAQAPDRRQPGPVEGAPRQPATQAHGGRKN